jgi:hypothetical protein
MSTRPALTARLLQAGAVITARSGVPVPAHYGSAAGELAVCVSGVGLANRADLSIVVIRGVETQIDEAVQTLVGYAIAPGGAALIGGAWWCRSDTADEVVLLAPHAFAPRLTDAVRAETYRYAGLGPATPTSELTTVGLVGKHATPLLADLGAFGATGDPKAVTPFFRGTFAGCDVTWLIENSTSVLALVAVDAADDFWHAIERAGREHRIACVGLEAVERFALLERSRRRLVTSLV